ncbi:MAG: DUF3035 domain-containing protein [Sphingomicrobium sp.]
MRKSLTLLLVAATVATSACSRRGGGEFAVAKNAPLVIPPDFSLAPPVTGAAGLSPTDAQQQAVDTLFGGSAPRPQIESSLLERAGGDMVKPGIRSTVWDPDTRVVDKGQATLQILSALPASSDVASAQIGQ